MKGPILVVLAAGMGSRYGGLKQMDKLGKNGEVLLDYSVFDALRSGFKKIVFIIRKDIEKDFRELVLARMGDKVDFELAFQQLDSLIPADIDAHAKSIGRTKPWGTAHALLCAKDKIDAPFAIINADDYYGRESFEVIGKYLANENVAEGAIVPYRIAQTLSPQGTVTRGICAVENDHLTSVDELMLLKREEDGKIYNTYPDGHKESFADDTPVSMNFWGFPPTIFSNLQKYFDDFLKAQGKEMKSECYLPMFADWLIKNNLLKIKSLPANAEWFGVTYKEDKEAAVKRIAELTASGFYPERLW
jgi:NDP-sugar pyrophosphorylase family protein